MSNTFLNQTSRVAIDARIAEQRRLQDCSGLTTPGDYHLPFGKDEARAEAKKGYAVSRLKMLLMVFAAAIALVAALLQPAKAYETPWCAVSSGGDGDMHWDCQYRSIEECRPNVLAGNRGWCNPNPYFVTSDRPIEHRSYRRRHNPQ